MKNLDNKLNKISEILLENNCLLELVKGYCHNYSLDVEEILFLLPALKTILSNHQNLCDKIDEIGIDFYNLTKF